MTKKHEGILGGKPEPVQVPEPVDLDLEQGLADAVPEESDRAAILGQSLDPRKVADALDIEDPEIASDALLSALQNNNFDESVDTIVEIMREMKASQSDIIETLADSLKLKLEEAKEIFLDYRQRKQI